MVYWKVSVDPLTRIILSLRVFSLFYVFTVSDFSQVLFFNSSCLYLIPNCISFLSEKRFKNRRQGRRRGGGRAQKKIRAAAEAADARRVEIITEESEFIAADKEKQEPPPSSRPTRHQ